MDTHNYISIESVNEDYPDSEDFESYSKMILYRKKEGIWIKYTLKKELLIKEKEGGRKVYNEMLFRKFLGIKYRAIVIGVKKGESFDPVSFDSFLNGTNNIEK